MQPSAVVSVRYPVRANLDAWVLPEGNVPEATAHALAVYRIFGMLRAWAMRIGPERSVSIASELAVRWLREHPRTGADPDVCVIEPPLRISMICAPLKLWEPGRVRPRLAIEVVSASLPHKDYDSIQERYAAMGVEELLVFDPLLEGPRSLGGPVALQLWRRDATMAFERVHFGFEPVYSQVLEAWCSAEGRDFHVSDDRRGTQRWLSPEEQVLQIQADAARFQAEAERAQAEAEHERQARVDLERRLAELESKLQR
ncbi:MAG TPA: Uma2 family endonuclease [Polyangiaceae bacterium]|nr:Uma2 family endonuclease [Polyangiaceae bacterium]